MMISRRSFLPASLCAASGMGIDATVDTRLFQRMPYRGAKGLVLDKKWGLFVHVPTIARSVSGVLVVACIGGSRAEPEPDNVVAMARSFDNGGSWTALSGVIDPQDGWRAFDPVLWTSPGGKIWLQWGEGDCPGFRKEDRRMRTFTGTLSVDERDLRLSDIRPLTGRKAGDWAINPPLVLKSGKWVATLWSPGGFSYSVTSDDRGKTWVSRELVTAKEVPGGLDEAALVELTDGRLWALYRTTGGRLYEAFSVDEGTSWRDVRETGIPNPGTKPFLLRLASGRILLLNNATFASRSGHRGRPKADQYAGRSFLTAALSEDDGRSFCAELVLDKDRFVCYPSAVQAPDGVIHIVYTMKTGPAYTWVGNPIEGSGGDVAVARIAYGQLTENMILRAGPPGWSVA